MNDDIKEVPTDEEEEARKPADEVTGEPDIEEASTDVLSKEKLDNLNSKFFLGKIQKLRYTLFGNISPPISPSKGNLFILVQTLWNSHYCLLF